MPRTPDRFPGEREEEGLLLIPDAVSPVQNGEIVYVTGVGFRFFEEGVEKGLTGTGITEAQHRALRQLVHLADEGGPYEGFASGAYYETLPAADPFPTSFIWWTSSAKTSKIVEETVTYNANKTIATDVWEAYDVDGSTVLVTVTDTISYSGVFETSRTRTIT
jgi:hypothetical protein